MHAPGHLREAFAEWVENGCADDPVGADLFYDGRSRSIRSLFGLLWNCSDIIPRYLCDELGVPAGSTYAQVVQAQH